MRTHLCSGCDVSIETCTLMGATDACCQSCDHEGAA